MNENLPNGTWAFVIDTDQYAGNFERDLCAFLTGQIGDCEVGDGRIGELPDRPDFENVVNLPDDHGCARPCSIWRTPGWYNAGQGEHIRGDATGKFPAYLSVAIFFESKPAASQLDFMMANARKFKCDKYGPQEINIAGFRLIQVVVTEKETALTHSPTPT